MVPMLISAKERRAYLAGYHQAHKERMQDLRRIEGDFLAAIDDLTRELHEVRQLLSALRGEPEPVDGEGRVTIQ